MCVNIAVIHFCVRLQLFSAEGCNRDTFLVVLVRRQKSSSHSTLPLFLSCSALSCVHLCLCVSQEAAHAQSFSSWQHDETNNSIILYDVCILYTLFYAHLYMHMKKTFTQTLTLQRACLQHSLLHISRNNEFKSYFKGLTCLQHYKMFLHAGFNITCRHSMTKPFWTSTCNTGHDEVSASARSFSAHKSKHNLSTYPLHLQEFG